MKKTFKGALAFMFCIVTIFATMVVASAISAPKAKVSAVTYNTVSLSWSKISGADFYEVERSTDGKKWTSLSKKVTGTSYKDSKSLTVGKTYKYRVRAVDDRLIIKDEVSAWSTVSAKPLPGKVTGLKVSSRTHNSVKLTWTKVAGASGYEIQYYTGSAWKSYKKTTSNTLTASSLTLGKTYQFRVRAYRTVSGKAVYGAVSSTVKTSPYLKATSTFVLKDVTTSTLKLSWAKVTGAKGYEVYNTVTKKWTNVKTATTLTVKSLKAGTKYGFIVRPYSGSYKGTSSATRYYTTKTTVPSGVKVTAATNSSVTFSWSKVTGAAGYQYGIYDYATKKWTYATTTKTSATVNNLNSTSKYAVRVRAYVKNSNVSGISGTTYSDWSSNAYSYTAPKAVGTITATNTTTSSVTFSWAKVAGATSYTVYRYSSSKKAYVSEGTTSGTSFTVKGLYTGTAYKFKVQAVLTVKGYTTRTSADSKIYTFTTMTTAPTGLNLEQTADSRILLSWNAAKGATGYEIYILKPSATSYTLLKTATSASAVVTSLKSNSEYAFKIRAYVTNSGKNYYTSYSNVIKFGAPVVSATGISKDNITLTWNAINGSTGYSVEKYDYYYGEWKSYDFASNKWRLNDEITDSSVLTTTETTFADEIGNSTRADVFRIISHNTDGSISISNYTTGYTSDIKLAINDYSSVTLTYPKVEGVTEYQIIKRYSNLETEVLIEASTKTTLTLNLAPESIHSLLVLGKKSDGSPIKVTDWITFRTKDLKIVTNSSDANYNASVNSQLLYLANSINNTKTYQDKITVKNVSEVSYAVDYLKLFIVLPYINEEATGAKNVAAALKRAGEAIGEDMGIETEESEKVNATVTFDNGRGTYNDKTVKLNAFIEPTSNSKRTAYLYQGLTSQTAWKNGISSVKTTKNSDGTYTIKAVLKQESANTNYHSGFISSFSIGDLGGEGITMDYFKVGASTLNAKIDSEGYLKAYSADAPYSAQTSADFAPLGNMCLRMSGKTNFNYTFTR